MISALLCLALTLASTDLDPRLEEALNDLRIRAPEVAERIEEALERDPEEAEEFLEEHADYLDRLREAPPELRALLLKQEALQIEVDDRVDAVLEAQDRADQAREEGEEQLRKEALSERDRLDQELADSLERWFDLRQEIRWKELEEVEEEMVELEERHDYLCEGENREEARAEWIDRILEEGPEAAEEQLAIWEESERWLAMAGGLYAVAWERADEGLDDLDPEEMEFEELVAWAEEDPEILELAIESAGPAYALEEGRVELTAFLLEHLDDGELELTQEEGVELRQRLDLLIETEIAAAGEELAQLRVEIEERRQRLERREDFRDLIVTVKHAELLGDEELLEW